MCDFISEEKTSFNKIEMIDPRVKNYLIDTDLFDQHKSQSQMDGLFTYGGTTKSYHSENQLVQK